MPAARRWLLDAITEALPDADVHLSGLVKEGNDSDLVIVENVTEVDREWAHLGRNAMDESYVVPITVQAVLSKQNLAAVEDRMWGMAVVIERLVAQYPTLGGLVQPIGASPDGAEAIDSGPSEGTKVLSRMTLRVRVEARVVLSEL